MARRRRRGRAECPSIWLLLTSTPRRHPTPAWSRLVDYGQKAVSRYNEAAQTRPLLGLPLTFLSRYLARQGVLLASATAFRLFLWLLPLALLSAGVLAGISGGDEAAARSATKTAGITGAARREVVTAISTGHRSWVQAVLIGAVLFVWATRTLVRNLTMVNAYLWEVRIPKRRFAAASKATLAFAGVFVVLVAGASALAHLRSAVPGAPLFVSIIEAAVVSAAWLVLSMLLPDSRTRWTDLLPGSVLVGTGLTVMNLVAQFYLPLRLEHASKLYGALGTAGVMLAWLLIVGQILVTSALMNAVWTDYRHQQH